MGERIAIIGVGETEFKGRNIEVSEVDLVNIAVKRALENAHLTIKNIDVVISGAMELFEGIYEPDMWMAEGDGAYLKSGMRIQSGGTTGTSVAASAFVHAASGEFNTVLAVAYEKQDEGSSEAALRAISEDVFYDIGAGGKSAAPGMAELAIDMLERGAVTEEQIAALRVNEAECASRNPYAHLRKKLTVEEVMNSRLLIPPLRLLHICPTSVGACAMIIAPESVAKKVCPNPAWVIDWVTIHAAMTPILGHQGIYLTRGPLGPLWAWSVEKSAVTLYKRNGITNPRKEFDVVEMYNMSTWHEAEWYERIHLCERNEAGKLIEKGTVFIEGDLPVNPSGGVVSTNAIGASAMLRVAEAAIQVRGEGGERQVDGVKTAFAVSAGGDTYSTAVLLRKHL